MTSYFNQHIALFQKNVRNQADIFNLLSNELLKRDLVTKEYCQKVEEREKIYPTGLSVNGIGVAIPHTDSDYVKASQIAFLSLKEPIAFNEMGTSNHPVNVKLIFMLALKEPHEQPYMLQKLIEMFQKKEVLKRLLDITTVEEFICMMHANHLK